MRSHILVSSVAMLLSVSASAWADPPPPPPPVPAATPTTSDAPTGAPAPTAPATEERSANNAIYAEGLGPGLLYSINYERNIGDFSARIGFGYISVSATASSGTSQETASASFFTVPITASYLGIGNKKHMLELGAGATIVHVGAGGSAFDAKADGSGGSAALTTAFPLIMVGYRYQPPTGGFFLKAGLSPIFGGSAIAVLPWPYLGLGGTF